MAATEYRGRALPSRNILIVIALVALLLGARTIASYTIEYQWWKEMRQVPTWTSMLLYSFAPLLIATILVFAVFWIAHARGMKFAGTGLSFHPLYAKLATFALLALAFFVCLISIHSWTVIRYFGGLRVTVDESAWRDPIFWRPLSFYLFELPFYSEVLSLLLAVAVITAILYWVTARGWQLRSQIPYWTSDAVQLDLSDLRLRGALESGFLRTLAALFLLALAGRFFLARYGMLLNEHGFLVGVDYVNHHINLPLQWGAVAACIVAAGFVLMGRWKALFLPAAALVLMIVVPPIVSIAYVKPNEISLQRPYITNHIQSTRTAFGLSSGMREVEFAAKLEAPIDTERNKALFDNVRLWDWRAFHDTVTQIQALRPYYVFNDTDVDRYVIDGQLRQVMVTPRELDIRQLSDARANWINAHFIYTHGYGVVMAEANRITRNGQPVLFVQDAPPRVETDSLQLTRPEIYYGEVMHEPVFVATEQPEFNYPSGSENVQNRYDGRGGIPISSFPMRVAAALTYADRNMLLTGYLTDQSRMMIRRDVRDRVRALAGFLEWDPDPYLVLTKAGRLVWMIDAYTISGEHPYSRSIRMANAGDVNYMRNAVKATVDAYDGTTTLYVFDEADPIIQAWQAIFPSLFRPASDMPEDLRFHARYPELFFRAQAETYRVFHMQDPEAFYNKEDTWDLAKTAYGQTGKPGPMQPTFVVATLPGETDPEFLLVQPFTPRNKDNLIGLMIARSDGEHLGEIVMLQLSKQSLIYGPLQIESRIDSDQVVAKDLALWNQQGSSVLRGQVLVLPLEETFLYVQPIYIQAAQARMPQLRKVVVAMGNTLIYRDTYEEAIAELDDRTPSREEPQPSGIPGAETVVSKAAEPQQAAAQDPQLETIRNHLRRYREMSAQGRWAEAGKELEALEALVGR